MAVTLSEVSDAELVTAYLGEKKDVALSELVRRHQIPVFRLLVGMLPTPDHAEAACERVFVDASQRLEELKDPEDFRSWVIGVAREFVRSDGGANETIELEPPVFEAARPPELLVQDAVQSALASLLPDERLALVMSDVQNEPVSAMAVVLGVAEAAVEKSVAQARDKFLTAMQGVAPTMASPQAGTGEAGAEDGDAIAGQTDLSEGAVVDKRYRVKTLLGSGGMGAVYCAEHVTLHRDVALKTLHGRLGSNEALRKRFVREAEVLGKLEHEHFVSVSDFGETDKGLLYLVMELLDGKSLGDLMERESLAPLRSLDIARQVLEGLSHAHDRGIVHRDVKPENIVLLKSESGGDFAKILDLGIATSASESSASEGGVYGTPAYMSPEQVMGDELDGRSDLYAVSVMLFELLTGHLPFDAPNSMAILAKQLSAVPPTLAEVAPDCGYPEELQEIFDKGLDKKPSQRFQSAAEFIESIDALLPRVQGEGAPAGSPPRRSATTREAPRARDSTARKGDAPTPGAEPATTTHSSWRWLVWLLLIALLVAGLMAVWRVMSG